MDTSLNEVTFAFGLVVCKMTEALTEAMTGEIIQRQDRVNALGALRFEKDIQTLLNELGRFIVILLVSVCSCFIHYKYFRMSQWEWWTNARGAGILPSSLLRQTLYGHTFAS